MAAAARSLILLIEDNQPIRRLVTVILADAGHSVISASSGAEGVELARSRQPDLILCDLELPDIDGFEVLNRVRAIDALSGVCIVAFTVLAMGHEQQRIRDAGFDGHIVKPIDPEAFLREVERFLADTTR